jgi:Tol biopolymer transport system component
MRRGTTAAFFTHDGSHIVWRRFDEQGLIADVWTMKPDGSDQRQITDFASMSWAPYEHPSGLFHFSTNKLGFENFELFMVDIEGKKEPVRVTYSDGFDGLPVPSPDGKTLAWTSAGRAGRPVSCSWRSGTTRRRSRRWSTRRPEASKKP